MSKAKKGSGKGEKFDVAVVGAGIYGLAAAYRLAKAGRRVVIFEKDRKPGGLSAVFAVGGSYAEEYHHFTSVHDDALFGLYKELGIEDGIGWQYGRTANWVDGGLHSFSNPLDVFRFPKLTMVDRLRFAFAFAVIQSCTRWKLLEGISVERFIRRFAGNRSYELVWAPLMESKFEGHAQDIPMSWLWARSRRRVGSKRDREKGQLFGYFKGSLKLLIDRLVEEIGKNGVQLRMGEGVRRVVSRGGAVSAVETGKGSYSCRSVLFTAPLPCFLEAVNGLRDELERRIRAIDYQAILNVVMITKRNLSDYFWINALSRDVPFPGIIELTRLRDPSELGGRHLIYLPRYIPKDSRLYRLPDGEVIDVFLRGVKRVIPTYDEKDVIECRVFRNDYADPFYTLNYSRKMPPHETGIAGLFLGNTAQIYPDTRSAHNSIKYATKVARMVNDCLGAPGR
jgi:protoporphyrinogen oxidase